MGTNFHVCIKLDKLLELTLRGTVGFLENGLGEPLSENEIYQLVESEKAKGYTYFSGCDNRDNDGRCLGHPQEENNDS